MIRRRLHNGSGQFDAASALSGLERFADRLWYLHLKDCSAAVARQAQSEGADYFAAVRHRVFCGLGKGAVDFPAVHRWLQQGAYRGWALVEQDVLPGMGTPKESARRNRAQLKSIGF